MGSVPGGADVLRSPVGAPPLDVPGVGNGTYFTRLRSVGPTGRSAPTPDLVVAVGRCTPPGAIALSGQGSASGVTLAWTPATGSAPFTYGIGAGTTPGALDVGVFPVGSVTARDRRAGPGCVLRPRGRGQCLRDRSDLERGAGHRTVSAA